MPNEEVEAQSCRSPVDQAAYAAALDYLYGRINYEKIGNTPYNQGNYRLDRMRQLLEILGNPHLAYSVIHVAGTKGKGTTAQLISSGLVACGLRTGLYTSPHLLSLEERIQFQGMPCLARDLVELTQIARQAAELLESRGGGRATFFELTTAMGFVHFARCQAEAVVLEVGLGGRLDSTNVCVPTLTVITSISLDHQAQLGTTIDAIAREKAGIIKPGIPLVCAARDPVARAVIEEIAASRQAPHRFIGRDFKVQWAPASIPPAPAQRLLTAAELQYASSVSAQRPAMVEPAMVEPAMVEPAMVEVEAENQSAHGTWQPQSRTDLKQWSLEGQWTTRLLGKHQGDNIAAALASLEVLRSIGWDLPIDKLQPAVHRTQPPARLEVVASSPLSIIDSAHNPASIQAGLDALQDHFGAVPLTIVFAASRDKDWREMLEQLLNRAERLILTAYRDNPRGLSSDDLQVHAEHLLSSSGKSSGGRTPRLSVAPSPAEAWHMARQCAAPGDVVYATGSFFLAAEIIAALTESHA